MCLVCDHAGHTTVVVVSICENQQQHFCLRTVLEHGSGRCMEESSTSSRLPRRACTDGGFDENPVIQNVQILPWLQAPCTHLSPFQPELVDEDDAIALRDGEPGAIGAEAQVPHDVVLRALLRGFGGEPVSFFAIFVVQSHHSVRLFIRGGRKKGEDRRGGLIYSLLLALLGPLHTTTPRCYLFASFRDGNLLFLLLWCWFFSQHIWRACHYPREKNEMCRSVKQ